MKTLETTVWVATLCYIFTNINVKRVIKSVLYVAFTTTWQLAIDTMMSVLNPFAILPAVLIWDNEAKYDPLLGFLPLLVSGIIMFFIVNFTTGFEEYQLIKEFK